MRSAVFSPEELAELAVIDAEIDAEPVTQAERDYSRALDGALRYRDKIAEAKRAYREANRDKIAEAQRAYYEANRDKIAEAQRAYREANRDKIAEAQRAYYEANRDKIAEAKRAYREANRDKIAEAKRAYYEANRDKIAEAQRAYREANRDKIAEIGAALRRWRKNRHYSQTELGLFLDVTQRTVSYWECGEVPIDFERIEREFPPAMEAFG